MHQHETQVLALRRAAVSYSKIGVMLGITRNAVAGILSRCRERCMDEDWQPAPPPPPPARGCRWIEGQPRLGREWSWCGAETLPGQAWCAEHRARVYRPSKSYDVRAESADHAVDPQKFDIR